MAGEWCDCTLADACRSIDYGLTASAADQEVGPRFLRITDIVSGHINWNSVPYVAADDESTAKYKLHDGDIVLARTGASTGASAFVKNPPPAVFASYLVRLQAKPEFDPRFLAYYLKSDDFWAFIHGVLGDKSAQPNASASTMTKAPLRAPRKKNEQRAIAHILGTLDDKIELNRRMNETLEAIARALFKSWFVDFDPVRAKAEGRDPGLPKPIADLFPNSFDDSELGEIPKGWETGVFDDLADVSSGKRPEVRHSEASSEANVPLWGGNGPMAFVPRALVEHPILLTGRVGTLGVVFRITTPCWPSDNTLIVRTKNETAFEYLFLQLRQIDFNSLNRGSTQPLLTQADLKVQPLLLPPLELLAHFHAATRELYRRVDKFHVESRILATLRDTLLPKLISGDLRVKDAERFVKDGD